MLRNGGFEVTVQDRDGAFDPAVWGVVEGKTRKGTGNVIREKPELVQVVTASEPFIQPFEGEKMLRVGARLRLKSSVHQFYQQPISDGALHQRLAVYPASGEYLQQIEVRGQPDFREVEGKELFHLRFADAGVLLRVRTGRPDFKGQSGFWKIFPPLPRGEWSQVAIWLSKTDPTRDGQGRTVSQWKLFIALSLCRFH